MINVLHLIWIVPLSMMVGVVGVICYVCAIIGEEADEEEKD